MFSPNQAIPSALLLLLASPSRVSNSHTANMFRFVSISDTFVPCLPLGAFQSLILSATQKAKDVITLFHSPTSSASARAAALLKEASTAVSAKAGGEPSTIGGKPVSTSRPEFDVEITEKPPTNDQLSTILSYIQPTMISQIVKGATSESEALKKFNDDARNFQRPVVRQPEPSLASIQIR
jgi:arsenate reductase-like glutaredoxin family protein